MTVVRLAVAVLIVAVAAALGFWAGRLALESPEDPLAVNPEPVTYVVEEGSVGRSLSFTAVADWVLVPAGPTGASGVVTSVTVGPGDVVSAGDELFTVDLRPVVVAEGPVPMFRSLGLRAEGVDVEQLQQLLADLGFYEDGVDGEFGSSTRRAVMDWQDSLDVDDSGVVGSGDIVFLAELPARVAPAESLVVGARLAGGESVLSLVPEDPVFRIPLSPEQSNLVPLSATVFVTYAEGVWEARIERAVESEFDQLDLILTAPDGGAVCGEVCADWVALVGESNFRAETVVIPETSGPVVPVGAITTGPANEAFVTLADGAEVAIRILESANGLAVVEGLEAGAEILLPVEE